MMSMITRAKYKEIKKMDRQSMETFLETFAANVKQKSFQDGRKAGYQEGVEAISSSIATKLIEKVESAIKSTPGIGQKRFDDIMNNITKVVTEDALSNKEDNNAGSDDLR